ncbi:hypothetical protein [Streptococcus caballi]|uniref:hypothetical protein n=1 Tax=Streptococcus caballi TaxID=439220 RepID=UPI00036F4969|nr:hypothetical protein [Streptococcus caballi]
MKKILLPSVTLLAALVLVGCSSTSGETSKMQQSSENLKVKSSSSSEEADTAMELWEKLADNSKSVEEIYVTGDITVGENQEVKAGIYDLQVTGGSGNISVEHGIYIPGFTSNYWIAGAADSGSDYPNVIRVALLNELVLKFSDISKIKLTAVPKTVTMTDQLGIGNYIVGRDIKAGTYKLSTNMIMDPQFDNLGWNISIANIDTGKSRSQTFNPGNQDVAVKLEDGEMITTNFDNTQYGVSSDTARLIFTQVNE